MNKGVTLPHQRLICILRAGAVEYSSDCSIGSINACQRNNDGDLRPDPVQHSDAAQNPVLPSDADQFIDVDHRSIRAQRKNILVCHFFSSRFPVASLQTTTGKNGTTEGREEHNSHPFNTLLSTLSHSRHGCFTYGTRCPIPSHLSYLFAVTEAHHITDPRVSDASLKFPKHPREQQCRADQQRACEPISFHRTLSGEIA